MSEQLPNLDAFIPRVENLIQPYVFPVPTGTSYTPISIARPCYLVPLTPATTGTVYWSPASNPSSDNAALQDTGSVAFLYAKGQWFVRHSGASTQSFRVVDAGGAGQAQAVADSTSSSLAILTLALVPVTWGAAAAVTINAASATALAANTSRRALLLTNASTGGQVLTVNLAGGVAVAGQGLVLTPNQTVIWNPLDVPTRGALTAIASVAGGSIGVAEGT